MKYISLLAALGLAFTSWSAQATDEHHPHWSYKGKDGPSHWNKLEKDFAGCKLGKEQSPINIHGAQKAKLEPIGFHYAAGPATVVNNGHTVQVNLAEGGSIQLPDGEYKLVQFHFHTPSEEKIEGVGYPLVAHFVHKNAEGKLAVVAVLFKKGHTNAALKDVFTHMPNKANHSTELAGGIDPTAILPEKQGYYAFTGSLTTPPCSEGVRWHVLKNTVDLSGKQLASFQKLYPMNARPVQGLNGRTLQASE